MKVAAVNPRNNAASWIQATFWYGQTGFGVFAKNCAQNSCAVTTTAQYCAAATNG
jgi:hypothetical protein